MVSGTYFKKDEDHKAPKIFYTPIYNDTVESTSTKSIFFLDKYIIKCILPVTIVLSIVILNMYWEKNFVDQQKYEELFNAFVKKYDRKYDSDDILRYRYHVFIQNVKEFEEEEKRHPGLDLDVTQFADWTDSELRKILHQSWGPSHQETTRFSSELFKRGENRPASIDWRNQGKLTQVKNQESCGSCWAFATVAAIEAQYAIKKQELVSLSEQELIDCDHRNNGCHGGYRPYAMNFVKRNGLEREIEYPYSAIEGGQCRLVENKTKIFIDNYEMLYQNEETIADWVATKGPVTFGMQVVKSMYSYRSGIYNPSQQDCKEKTMGSHALVIVGYGTEGDVPYWIVKNSWGTSWGADGYFRLARGVNSCGAAENVCAPIIN